MPQARRHGNDTGYQCATMKAEIRSHWLISPGSKLPE
jgi:hypothetical protein